jgi:hypothetical protein
MVATAVAASGLALDRPPAAWIADGPTAFATAVLDALAAPGERRRRAQRAAALVARRHDRAAIIRDLACRLDPASAN